MSKILLIGANHAGTAAANTILDNYGDKNELIIFDRNDNISYLGCGTALWIGRQLDDPSQLFYSSKEALEEKGATVHLRSEVQNVDFNKKIVTVKLGNNHLHEESYDKLILATGSLPITPPIPGIDKEGVESVKLYQDGAKINKLLDDDKITNVAVVGAGYIGVEIAEAIQRRGKKALLFDVMETSLASYYDPEFTHQMDKVLADGGVELHFGEGVKEIAGGKKVEKLITDKGEYEVQLVIMAIGFVPNNGLGKETLSLGEKGAYLVDRRQQTSMPNVYAIGDCASIYSNALRSETYIALATNAVRSGIIAGHNVCSTKLESPGVQGSNGICIFGYKMVSTGLNLAAAKKAGFDVAHTDFEDLQKPAFIKEEENAPVKLRIVYDKTSRRILGAQMASTYDMSMGIHMFSLAIEEGLTIDKLKLLDIFFLPHFNQPYNYITMAALSAE